MQQREFIRKELEALTRIPARTIQYYTDRQLLYPDIDAPTGRGTRRKYSRKNLFELFLIQQLSHNNIKLDVIRYIIKTLRKSHSDIYWDNSKDVPKSFGLMIGDPHIQGIRLYLNPGVNSITLPSHYRSALIINIDTLIKRFLDALGE